MQQQIMKGANSVGKFVQGKKYNTSAMSANPCGFTGLALFGFI
jgi:hypothetical protein